MFEITKLISNHEEAKGELIELVGYAGKHEKDIIIYSMNFPIINESDVYESFERYIGEGGKAKMILSNLSKEEDILKKMGVEVYGDLRVEDISLYNTYQGFNWDSVASTGERFIYLHPHNPSWEEHDHFGFSCSDGMVSRRAFESMKKMLDKIKERDYYNEPIDAPKIQEWVNHRFLEMNREEISRSPDIEKHAIVFGQFLMKKTIDDFSLNHKSIGYISEIQPKFGF